MKSIQLKNGLKVFVEEMPHLYSVSLAVMVGVGSGMETPEENGISHVIEHMVFKGTERRSAQEISEFIEDIGGQINAYTGKDTTCFYTKTAAEHLEACCDLLSDMLFCPKFDEAEFAREKRVILEEILMGEDEPDEVCHDLIASALFGNDSLGQTIIGTKETVSSFTTQDLRNFMQKYYNAGNTVVCVAGGVTAEAVFRLAEQYFDSRFTNESKRYAIPKQRYSETYLSRHKKTEQAHLALAYPSVSAGDDLAPAVAVLNYVLGGGMSSRLFQSVREQSGLAYSVFSYGSAYQENGYLEIYAGTTPEKVEKVWTCLKEEVSKLKQHGISLRELQRGKEQLRVGTILAQENSLSVATAMGASELRTGKVRQTEERLKKIEQVDMPQIERAIALVFGNRPSACYVGEEKAEKNPLN